MMRLSVPSLPLSVGLGPSFSLEGALTELESRDCHFHLIPFASSYLSRSLAHSL
jgi:hypothetical protein